MHQVPHACVLSLIISASCLAACSSPAVDGSPPGDPANGGETGVGEPSAAGGGTISGQAGQPGQPSEPIKSLPSGAVDPTYGTGGLVASAKSDRPFVTAVSPSGRVVYAASKSNRFVQLHVFTPDGRLDATASGNTAGVEIPGADNHSEALSFVMKLADDGAVMLYGQMRKSGAPTAFVARIKNGALDPAFGVGGVRVFPYFQSRYAGVADVRDGAGAVVGQLVAVSLEAVGSLSPVGERAAETRLYKLTTTGAIDTTFGTGGWTKVPGWTTVRGGGLLQEANGQVRVLTARTTTPPMANSDLNEVITERLTAEGALDAAYGAGGTATATVTPFFLSSSLPLRNGDTLLGFSANGARRVQRLTTTGALSSAFPGIPAITLPNGADFVAEDADGKLLSADNDIAAGGTATLTRWTAAGAIDATFAKAGVFTAPRPREFLHEAKPLASGGYLVVTVHYPAAFEYYLAVRRVAK